MTPYPDSIDVPFRGKTVRARLSHASILRAERDLGVNILYFQEPMLVRQPIGYQMAAWLYLLVSGKIKNVTFDECVEESMGEHREFYLEIFGKLVGQLTPILLEVNGQKEVEVTPPLDESDGGETDGLPLESISE